MRRRGGVALALFLALAGVAEAQDGLSAQDAERLADLDRHLGRALRQALAEGAPADLDALTAAMGGVAWPPERADLAGDWSCRVMKLGDISPLVVYSPFRCRITAGDEGWKLEKLSGSQLTQGEITRRDGALVYRGTGYIRGDPFVPYEDVVEGRIPEGAGQVVPQVALVEQTGPDRVRLLFPDPILESDFDLLVLSR